MKYFFTILLLPILMATQAQEQLLPLQSNPILKTAQRPAKVFRQAAIELPFVDDFYPTNVYPDPTLWEDDLVYVNASFAVDPPTIGVATFDGLNAIGEPYSIVSNAYGLADVLTSVPINLSGLTNEDDVYLSFFYQQKGLGDAPDFDLGDAKNQDYLIVEFKDTAGVWDTAWIQAADTNRLFNQVFLKVEDDFLHGDFQLRFKAFGRLTGAYDHWHIDYVKVDRNRDPLIETSIPEMAYQYYPTSLLAPYYVMPYEQFDSTYMVDSHSVFIRNNFVQATTDIIDFYKAEVVNTGAVLADFTGNSRDIGPTLSFREDYDSFNIPQDLMDDTVIIRVNYSFLVSAEDTTNEVTARNNQVTKDQIFSNYLAYDDGNAEVGYGLTPQQADALYGRTVLKYHVNKMDTLQAIKVHFVNYTEEPFTSNNENFSVFVWRTLETDSTTEELLYQKDFINFSDLPVGDTTTQMNKFTYIPIDPDFIADSSEYILVEGDFYIGIGVEVNNILTIGFDVNTDGSDYHYLDFGLGWTNTQFDGSLMLNPVIGKTLPDQYVVVSNHELVIASLGLAVYPNPTQQYLKVNADVRVGHIQIMDMLGKLILEQQWNENTVLDVSTLSPGMYVIQITDSEKGVSGSKQFIKQ
ncbi:MAG: T9SS type A sorting domain-containing protein [Chitinophagales bacterium]